jgi:Uma2 family endonuclease
MAVDVTEFEMKIISKRLGLELDLELLQGLWTEEQYIKLTDQTNHLIEFTDGVIEVLPMPTREHQKTVAYLYRLLFTFVQNLGGIVLFAPLRVRIRPGIHREPDLLVLFNEHDERNQNSFWLGADLVMEIVSPDNPERDTEDKVADYAEARIPEYWIVNPLDETITVLILAGDAYTTHGLFQRGDIATSALIEGFSARVDDVFNAR